MSGDRRRGDLGNLVRTRLGRTSVSSLPAISVGVLRPLNGGSPLNGDSSVAGYSDEWEACPGSANGQTGDYWLPMKASNVTSSTPSTPVILNAWYELRSKPFRYVLAASSTDVYGGVVCDFAVGYENRSTGPDAGNHLSPLMATAVGIRPPISGFGWGGEWSDPFSGSVGSTKTIDITHGRVNINGSDASGIVALPGGATASIPLLAPVDMTDAEVTVDLWYRVTVFIPGSLSIYNETAEPVPGTNTPIGVRGSCVTCDRNHIFFTQFNNTSQSPWYRSLANPFLGQASYGATNIRGWANLSGYTLHFDRKGPGGVSSLQLQEQDGWTYSVSGGTTTMNHIATQDFVIVQVGREVPRIQVFKRALSFDPTGISRRCNYSPRGIERYPSFQMNHFSFDPYATPARADWQRDGTTVFAADGRVIGLGSFTEAQTWYPPGVNDVFFGQSIYEDYPLAITMVPT